MALLRTAKSCGSDAPGPASSLREEAQATVSSKPGHREEREVSRKTIARGMPGRSGVTVVTTPVWLFFYTRGCGAVGCRPLGPWVLLPCFCFFTHEAAGASSARHSLRPLFRGAFSVINPDAT